MIWGGGQKKPRLYQFSIPCDFAKLCSDSCKDVLISGLCPKEICLIRERMELQSGPRVIKNHESSLALTLGHHQRNCRVSTCIWARIRARREGESCFWPGHSPSCCWAGTSLPWEESGEYDSSHVNRVTWRSWFIPFHLTHLFEQLYWGIICIP